MLGSRDRESEALDEYIQSLPRSPFLSKDESVELAKQRDNFKHAACEALYSVDIAQIIAMKLLSDAVQNNQMSYRHNDGSDFKMYYDALVSVYRDNLQNFKSSRKPDGRHISGYECRKKSALISERRRNIALVLSNLEICVDFSSNILKKTEQVFERAGIKKYLFQSVEKALENIAVAKDNFKAYQCIINEFVLRNLRLVPFLAKSFLRKGVSVMDLICEGNVGLIEGADKYDYKRGTNFSTAATWYIRKQILQALKTAKIVHLPVYLYDVLSLINRVEQNFLSYCGRRPSLEEISATTGKDIKTIISALSARRSEVYLRQTGDDDKFEDSETNISNIEDKSKVDESKTNRDFVNSLLEGVNSNEREILKMRAGWDEKPKTLDECKKVISLSRERVRQIEKEGLTKIIERINLGQVNKDKFFWSGQEPMHKPSAMSEFQEQLPIKNERKHISNESVIGEILQFDFKKFAESKLYKCEE